MARHRRWSWSSIALLPCRDGILFHRGIRYVCRQTNWTQATPRRHFLAQDGILIFGLPLPDANSQRNMSSI
jgi:hypothetical protein